MAKTKDELVEYVLKELQRTKGVIAVYLFGSQVNGRSRQDSDIDICVITNKKLTRKQKLSILALASKKVDINIFSDLPENIRFRVIKGGKLLYVSNELLLHRIKVQTLRNYLDLLPLIKINSERVLKNV